MKGEREKRNWNERERKETETRGKTETREREREKERKKRKRERERKVKTRERKKEKEVGEKEREREREVEKKARGKETRKKRNKWRGERERQKLFFSTSSLSFFLHFSHYFFFCIFLPLYLWLPVGSRVKRETFLVESANKKQIKQKKERWSNRLFTNCLVGHFIYKQFITTMNDTLDNSCN